MRFALSLLILGGADSRLASAALQAPSSPATPASANLTDARLRAALTATVDFSDVSGPAFTVGLPVVPTAERLLAHAGLRMVPSAPDLVLRITMESQAQGRGYNVQVMNAPIGTMQLAYRYTEARLSGVMEFKLAGVEPLLVRYSGQSVDPHFSPMATFGTQSRMRPEDAPFQEAFRIFPSRLFAELHRCFGPKFLASALGDKEPTVRSLAMGYLPEAVRSGDPGATATLVRALTDEDKSIRGAAQQAFSDLKEVGADLLVKFLKDLDAKVRIAVMGPLRDIAGKVALDGFVSALGDPEATVRKEALVSLSNISYRMDLSKAPGIAEALITILRSDTDPEARKYAIRPLARLRDPRTVDLLIGILESPDTSLHEEAANELTPFAGRNLGTKAKHWRKWQAQTQKP